MDRLALVGRVFFAAGLAAFGVQQFLYGDFVPGRAPAWPASVPGRLAWAYLSGALLIASGAAIAAGRRARWPAFLCGSIVFVWAFLRHIPLAAADGHFGGAWTQLGKGLVLSGGTIAVAGSLPVEDGPRFLSGLFRSREGLLYLGRVCLGLFLIASGVQHFLFPAFVRTLVPAWIPGDLFWTYFAAVALIAGGVGLILPVAPRLAGALVGLMIFLWVLLLHIPRALAAPDAASSRNEWIAVFEALAFSGLAFLLAGTTSRRAAQVEGRVGPDGG
jgi:uncharacterized membrane protein YphA (DoxX/SURF4 family)